MKIDRKIRNVLSTALIVAILGTMLTGCSKGGSEDTSNVLKFGCTNFSESLDPSAMPNAAWAVSRYGIGESLFKFDDKMDADYNLCDKYSVNNDNTEWKFHIRDGLKFSNGKEVNASSVVKSIEYMYAQEESGKGSTAPSQYMVYDSIKADDKTRTVTIKTGKPYADLTKALAHPFFEILDMDSDLASKPIGTGPYAIDKYDVGVSVAMNANEHYWKEEVPYEKLKITFIEDSTTKAMALQNGDVDVVENINTANDLKKLKDSPDFNVTETVGVRTGFAYINQKGILKNDDLRRAILTAVDDDTLCNKTVGGLYTPGASVLPSTLDYGYDKLKDTTPFDEKKANEILDDAKIVDTDGDGYRELDGKNVELNFLTYDSRNLTDFADGVASQLEKIGIKANIKKTDADTEWNMLVAGEYDLLNTNWMTVQDGDPYGYLDNWYGKSKANYCGYQNDEFDEIYEKLSTEMNEEKRKEMIQQLQQILIDDGAVMIHGYYNSNMSSSKSVDGAKIRVADYYWISTDMKPAK
ncbi:ABC transporter substrate-binding protein [Terrisporobacter sp.]